MTAAPRYVPYEQLVVDAADKLRIPGEAAPALLERWHEMNPWPDSAAVSGLELPYAFVTNCSRRLARLAAGRSRLAPRFVLSADEAGWYKPDPRIYREACRLLGFAPEATLFVAGSAYDAEGAEAAGLQAVHVARRADERSQGGPASLAEVVAGLRPHRPG
jgi:2-haloalkanoic acid dehalogenase type II